MIHRAQPLDVQGRHNTQPPPLKEVFNLDAHGLHVLLHARPGSISSVLGILIDYAFRVNRRSVFGYALTHILTPTGRNIQTTF